MRKILGGLLGAFLMVALVGCGSHDRKYVIGISQCSLTDWRYQLKDELVLASYFNEDVEIRMAFADDDDVQQSRQIDSLLNTGLDLLIVSPNQVKGLSGSMKRAQDMKVPVILYDRKMNDVEFTAFMGADNYAIGNMMGEFAAAQLKGKGNIAEIGGLKGSSPAKERHQGFADAIKKYPDLKIVGYAEGDWKEESGAKAMEEILKYYDGPIDLVFGDNDRMALGARKVLSSRGQLDGLKKEILYLGVDALPIPDGGMENVRDGLLTASGIYPICGDELIDLALKILRGEPYEKNNLLETSIVTRENANVLLLQYREVQKRAGYIAKMHNLVGKIKDESETQTMLSIAMCLFTGVVFVFLILIIHANRVKDCLNEELRRKNDELIRKNEELDAEKAPVEQQRDQLEEQRDQLLDATTQTLTENQPAEPEKFAEIPQKNEFMEKFLSCVDKKLDSPTLSVEDISQEMCVSRVQLYRKVKSLAQKSPVEIIRERRLQRASELLQDPSLSISEVAYRVGFSAPSYFTKCYKEFFGKNPRS